MADAMLDKFIGLPVRYYDGADGPPFPGLIVKLWIDGNGNNRADLVVFGGHALISRIDGVERGFAGMVATATGLVPADAPYWVAVETPPGWH